MLILITAAIEGLYITMADAAGAFLMADMDKFMLMSEACYHFLTKQCNGLF